MKTILNTIIDFKKAEVDTLKKKYSIGDFEQSEFFNKECLSLKTSIEKSDFGIIAEIKRKSPSAGNINSEIDIKSQGLTYQSAGAVGISCLTDYQFFGGKNDDLTQLKKHLDIPILRKEFIIDEFQLFEAKAIGADAVLLIAEVLTKEEALHFTIMAQQLGMEVLMEVNSISAIQKLNPEVDIIGVNNRNLHLQKTDIHKSFDLFPFLPQDRTLISESGIKTRDELISLQKTGYNGALIGESILKQNDPKLFIEQLNPTSHVS